MRFFLISLVLAAYCRALTTKQQAGLRVIHSYHGLTPPQSLLDAISNGYTSGVIFFTENVGSNFATVVKQLKSANAKSPTGLPLLLMTDQEGGQIRRLPGGPQSSARTIGQSSNPSSAATTAGNQAAQALISYGLNLNLAPILGIYRTAGDFLDQYGRSFGQNASIVTTCSTAFIKAQQAQGVAATAKHFPGLGAAGRTENTDETPVTLNVARNTLKTLDEAPYTSAINTAKVQLVMPSWAIYPTGDSLPSGLSPYWIQSELRSRLGFTGVTISDAIEAGALQSFGSNATRGVKAAAAGIDLVLASARDVNQGISVVNAIADAITKGTIDASANQAAVSRIQALRKTFA